MKKETCIRWFFVYSCFFVALVVLGELVGWVLHWPHASSAMFVYDDELGYRYPTSTHIDFEIKGVGYQVDFDVNSVADKRVVGSGVTYLLGDGLVAGLELPLNDRLAFRLSQLSGRSIINYSVAGYGAIQQERQLIRLLRNGNVPEHVFLIMNLDSDLIDNVYEWEGVRVPTVSITNEKGRILEPRLPDIFFRSIRFVLMKSRLYGKLLAVKAMSSNASQPDERSINLLSNLNTDDAQAAIFIMLASIRNIQELALQHRFDFHVVLWVDPDTQSKVGGSAVARLVKAVESVLPPHKLSQFQCYYCAGRAQYYVEGARHFDTVATHELSSHISRLYK